MYIKRPEALSNLTTPRSQARSPSPRPLSSPTYSVTGGTRNSTLVLDELRVYSRFISDEEASCSLRPGQQPCARV
jgi:hypothetical protein